MQYDQSKYNYRERNRAKCILLSHNKYTVTQLSNIFSVKNNAILGWLNRWEKDGINGLFDKKGKGRKKIYSEEEEKMILDLIRKEPRDIKQVLISINKEISKTSSNDTIKRILDRNNFTWRRIRRVPKKKPDEEIYKKNKRIGIT